MLLPPSNKLIAHVDMNSYFASVEQQANPTLRGKPLGVCAYLHEQGCVIAASVEAKRFGMKVGMSVREARAMCPHAVFIENDPAKYRAVTSRVFSILGGLTDRLEPYSIDEAFLDLTGWYGDPAEAAWALSRARRRITAEVGEWLRCSIGIAPTRFLAKTASKMEKPSGLTVVSHDTIDDMLAKLSLIDLYGIGPRMERRFRRLGIYTPLALKRYPLANLVRLFGKYGFTTWAKLHGWESETVRTAEEECRKSIGHSYCIPDRVNAEGKVLAVLMRLTERAARRMRAYRFLASVVTVAVSFREDGDRMPVSFRTGSAARWLRLDAPAEDSFTLTAAATGILNGLWHGERLRFLSVTLSEFSVPDGQLVFGRPALDAKKRVSAAVDMIRDRYGDEAIMLGSMFGAGDHAPERIGFRKTDMLREFSHERSAGGTD